jgi:hypothetical protein
MGKGGRGGEREGGNMEEKGGRKDGERVW